MSLTVIKPGLFDSVQDLGRRGYRALGIGSGGCMDGFSASIANYMLGNPAEAAVLECHFPAPSLQFNAPVAFALAGGDFSPILNGLAVPMCSRVWADAGSVLAFAGHRSGARVYLAVAEGFQVPLWSGGSGTHLLAGRGGWEGRLLRQGDTLPYNGSIKTLNKNKATANPDWGDPYGGAIAFMKGREWDQLTFEAQMAITNATFEIQRAGRMGYALKGPVLARRVQQELVSTAVDFGTLQLLPNGQLMVLMADHQTTGGFPRVGHVISAHRSKLAQLGQQGKIRWAETDVRTAEDLWIRQRRCLDKIKWGVRLATTL